MYLFATSIAHNLRSLLRFTGEDTRQLFWPYAITVIVLNHATFVAIIVPQMQGAVFNIAKDRPMAIPDFSGILRLMIIFMAITFALLAASTVRRLRDRGKSPLWVLVPPALIIANLVITPWNPVAMPERSSLAVFVTSVVTLAGQISLIYVIVLLAGRSRMADQA